MDMFVHGIISFAKFISDKNKIYVYKFSCNSERNVFANVFGVKSVPTLGKVCHADDLMYLFPVKLSNLPVDKESESYEMVNRVCTLWTNFAKYGDPTPESSLGVKWNPFTVERQGYLDIGGELKPSERPEHEDMELWDELFKQYLPSWF